MVQFTNKAMKLFLVLLGLLQLQTNLLFILHIDYY